MVVDAEVVPVDEEDQVVQAQPPGRVPRLVAGAGGQPALALDGEDLDLAASGVLQRQRLARRGRACRGPKGRCSTSGTSVLPSISAWPDSPPLRRRSSRSSQVRAYLPSSGNAKLRVAVALVPRAQRLVEHGETWRRPAARCGPPRARTGREKRPPRTQDVPAHRAGEHRGQRQVHLGPGAAGVPALAVVQHQVDHLVDQVLGHLPVLERTVPPRRRAGPQFRLSFHHDVSRSPVSRAAPVRGLPLVLVHELADTRHSPSSIASNDDAYEKRTCSPSPFDPRAEVDVGQHGHARPRRAAACAAPRCPRRRPSCRPRSRWARRRTRRPGTGS